MKFDMHNLLTTDNIAVYGAVVATFAFIITVFQYWASIKEKQIQLKISYRKHPHYEDNIIQLKQDAQPWEKSSITPLYIVTIRNIGNVSAFINEIFGISSDKVQYHALTHKNSSSIMSKINNSEIFPKSSQDFEIFFKEESTVFDLEKCIIVDGTGKQWKGAYNG